MSNEKFGTRATRLSSMAAMLLGWRPHEFWESTPAELAATLQPEGTVDGLEMEMLADLMRRFPD